MLRQFSWIAAMVAALLTVAAMAFAVGSYFSTMTCLSVTTIASLVAAILSSVVLLRRRGGSSRMEKMSAAALLVYIPLAEVTGCFAWVGARKRDTVFAVIWLAPLVLGAVVLPRRGCWRVGVACWSVFFAACAGLVYSATHDHSGVGLYHAWLE